MTTDPKTNGWTAHAGSVGRSYRGILSRHSKGRREHSSCPHHHRTRTAALTCAKTALGRVVRNGGELLEDEGTRIES